MVSLNVMVGMCEELLTKMAECDLSENFNDLLNSRLVSLTVRIIK